MKKIVLLAMMMATGYSAMAQDEVETTITADFVNQYIWRGQDLGSTAVQPTLGIGYKGHTSLRQILTKEECSLSVCVPGDMLSMHHLRKAKPA